jgi:hypothetical protein
MVILLVLAPCRYLLSEGQSVPLNGAPELMALRGGKCGTDIHIWQKYQEKYPDAAEDTVDQCEYWKRSL